MLFKSWIIYILNVFSNIFRYFNYFLKIFHFIDLKLFYSSLFSFSFQKYMYFVMDDSDSDNFLFNYSCLQIQSDFLNFTSFFIIFSIKRYFNLIFVNLNLLFLYRSYFYLLKFKYSIVLYNLFFSTKANNLLLILMKLNHTHHSLCIH